MQVLLPVRTKLKINFYLLNVKHVTTQTQMHERRFLSVQPNTLKKKKRFYLKYKGYASKGCSARSKNSCMPASHPI